MPSCLSVLHLVPSYAPAHSIGGPIESTHRLCQALKNAGANVRVLTTDAAGPQDCIPYPRDRWVEHDGVAVKYCRGRGRIAFSSSFVASLPDALRDADLVHVTAIFSFAVPVSILAAGISGRPFVLSPRGVLEPWPMSQKRWKKAPALALLRPLIDRAAAIHATSQMEAASIERLGLRPPVIVVPNAVVPGSHRRGQRDTGIWRGRLGLGLAQPMLLMLGRLHHKKGFDIALDAMGAIRRAHPGAVLVVAGPDAEGYGTTIDAIVQARGLQQAVARVGMITGDDKFQLLAESDVLLLPSRQENFANVVVEALSVGTPVVASRATPWEELELEGCGRWVDLAPASFAAAVTELLFDANTRRRMGENGRSLVRRKYEWSSVARTMLDVYRACIEGRYPMREHARDGPSLSKCEANRS